MDTESIKLALMSSPTVFVLAGVLREWLRRRITLGDGCLVFRYRSPAS